MKKGITLLFLLLTISVAVTACDPGGVTSDSEGVDISGEFNSNGQWVPDLSKTIKLELMEKGWVNTPTGGDESDPYWSWIKETFNIELKLTNTSEFATSIMVRFASQNPPDIISFDGADNLRTLYAQGVLMNDWNPYLEIMPTVAGNIGDLAKKCFTQDGKLIVLPGKEVTNTYGFRIRGDWLEKLKLDMPDNPESLLEVARAFTFNDPDGNGKNDTFGFSSAGSGTSLGEISNFLMMWGHPGFYIKNNDVDHPIINDNMKLFLDFMKTVHDEKIIDPDWFIQGWEQRKGQMYRGTYGILWYTGALITEIEHNTGNTGVTAKQWTTLPMPRATEEGGKLTKGDISSYLTTVSANAANDSEKLSRILYFIEQVTYPNEGFYKLRYGDGYDYYFEDVVIDGKNTGYKYLPKSANDFTHYRSAEGVLGSADYGTWIDVDVFKVIHSVHESISESLLKQIRLEEEILAFPTYPDHDHSLVLDPQIQSDVAVLTNEFCINYILGYDNDYEAFKSKWLISGGQDLIDQAYEQFKAYGFIE